MGKQANPPEKIPRRIAVILGSGGSSRNLLNLVLPLLGRGGAIEMHGVFLEEAGLQHAAELPFVQELCRVTFSVREFNSEQFERALALRMRTARRALSVLARHAGVTHSFRNVRGSAINLLVETARTSDITLFEPSRMMTATIASPARIRDPLQRIVVIIGDLETGSRALLAASHLAGGQMQRVSVLLTPSAAVDETVLNQLFSDLLPRRPGRVRTIPGFGVQSLVDATRSEGAAMLVIGATKEFIEQEVLQVLRDRLRCPICLVRQWDDDAKDSTRILHEGGPKTHV